MKMHPKTRSKEAGFSILEMLVFLALIGIVASVSLPFTKGPPDRLRIEAAARRLQQAMQTARAAAISSNTEQVLTIDTNFGIVTSTASAAIDTLGDISVSLMIADAERKSRSVGGFRFFPDGSSTGGTIELSLNSLEGHISVDWRTGRIYLDKITHGA